MWQKKEYNYRIDIKKCNDINHLIRIKKFILVLFENAKKNLKKESCYRN